MWHLFEEFSVTKNLLQSNDHIWLKTPTGKCKKGQMVTIIGSAHYCKFFSLVENVLLN